MTEDERAIRELVRLWFTATRDGDVDTVLGLMTEDVVFMVPGKPPFGKAEFAAASRAMQKVKIEGRSDIEELRVLGDWAYVRGRIDVAVTPWHGGAMKHSSGNTLTILRKEKDGRWRLARDANLLA